MLAIPLGRVGARSRPGRCREREPAPLVAPQTARSPHGRTIFRGGETARTRGSRARLGGGGHGAGGGNARSGRARVEQGAEHDANGAAANLFAAQCTRRAAGCRRAAELARARGRVHDSLPCAGKIIAIKVQGRNRDRDIPPWTTAEAPLRRAGREGGGVVRRAQGQDRALGADPRARRQRARRLRSHETHCPTDHSTTATPRKSELTMRTARSRRVGRRHCRDGEEGGEERQEKRGIERSG